MVTLITGALAMAAVVTLFVIPAQKNASPSATMVNASLIPSRSTIDLFDAEPFPRSGGESQRIDRILSSRAADLRANRFATWGVR